MLTTQIAAHSQCSEHDSLEAAVRRLHLELDLTPVVLGKLLVRLHAVEMNEPLDDMASAFKVNVRDFVDALNHLAEQRVQLVLAGQAKLERVEEGDEVLCCENGGLRGRGRGLPGGRAWRGAAGGRCRCRRVRLCCGKSDFQALGGAGTFKLVMLVSLSVTEAWRFGRTTGESTCKLAGNERNDEHPTSP